MNRTTSPSAGRSGRKPSKLSVIRARCDDDTKQLVVKAADRLGLDESDVLRMAARDFASRVVFQQMLPALA